MSPVYLINKTMDILLKYASYVCQITNITTFSASVNNLLVNTTMVSSTTLLYFIIMCPVWEDFKFQTFVRLYK